MKETRKRKRSRRSFSLKTWTQYYDDVAAGKKPFEIRVNDRGYRVGDILILKRYNPYTQLDKNAQSSSAIYIAALKLASMKIGKVRTLHFDASYLDKNSLNQIEEWANENDLQLLIERPDFDAGDITYKVIRD